nr:RNA-directed DNA polymerase, eukaryota, reverse transcriptase zinc-binding domain protein [Tanacetum cinerariifolium]
MACRTGPMTDPDRTNPDRTVPFRSGPRSGVLDQIGFGIGNLEYARVLGEMDATNELKSETEIEYKDKNNNVKGNKIVQVEEDKMKEKNAESEEPAIEDVLEINTGTTKVMEENEINGIKDRVRTKDSYGV